MLARRPQGHPGAWRRDRAAARHAASAAPALGTCGARAHAAVVCAGLRSSDVPATGAPVPSNRRAPANQVRPAATGGSLSRQGRRGGTPARYRRPVLERALRALSGGRGIMSSMRGAIRIAALCSCWWSILVSSPLGTSAASPQGSVVVRSVWSRRWRARAHPRLPPAVLTARRAAPAHALPPPRHAGNARRPLRARCAGSAGQPDRQRRRAGDDRRGAQWRATARQRHRVGRLRRRCGSPLGHVRHARPRKAIDAAYARSTAAARVRSQASRWAATGRSISHSVTRPRSASPRAGRGTSSPTRPAWTAGGLRDLEGALAAALGHPSGARAQAPADRDVVLLGPDGPASSARTCRSTRRSRSWAFRTASAVSPAGTTPRSGVPRWRLSPSGSAGVQRAKA